MLFKEALKEMEDGFPMRRASWPHSEGYLQVMKGMKHVWKIMLLPNPNAGNFIFAIDDFHADDWIAFKEEEESIALEIDKEE